MNLYRLVHREVETNSVASSYANAFDSMLEIMNDDYSALQKALSNIDKHVSDIYHNIEGSSFNVVQGYYFAKELKDALQKRRVIKGEYYKLKSFKSIMEAGIKTARKRQKKILKKDRALRDSLNTLIGLSDVAEDIWK